MAKKTNAYALDPNSGYSESMPWFAKDFGTGDPMNYGLDLGDKNMYETMLKKTALGMWPSIARQIQNATQLAPQQTAAQNSLIQALNPANVQSIINSYNNQANQNAAAQSRLAGLMARNAGMSSGAAQGAQMDVLNQANAGKNAYMGQLLSPQGIQQMYGAYLNAINGAAQSPMLQNLMGIVGATPGHQESTANGWMSTLGGVASLIPGLGTAGKALGALGGLFG